MRSRSIKAFFLFSLVLCIGMTSSLRAEYIQENSYKIQAQQTGQTNTSSGSRGQPGSVQSQLRSVHEGL
jgi:hypothetical protein